MKLKNKIKNLKIGEEIKFEIKNPNWTNPITMIGKIKALQSNRFNGVLCIEKGAVSEDEFIIRVESIK